MTETAVQQQVTDGAARNEFLAIMGPSGSGKSTLMDERQTPVIPEKPARADEPDTSDAEAAA